MKGKVGRAFHRMDRWKNDIEYKEIQTKRTKEWGEKKKKERREYFRMKVKQLNEFKNKRCKECNKLLNYATKGDYCFKHFIHRKRKLKKENK